MRCEKITFEGRRCKRGAKDGAKYCYQHEIPIVAEKVTPIVIEKINDEKPIENSLEDEKVFKEITLIEAGSQPQMIQEKSTWWESIRSLFTWVF
jgi:hypothetical protein